MEQNIDQIAQEMTGFCYEKMATSHALPVKLKDAFLRTKGKIFALQLDKLRKHYPIAVTTLVVISLLVGDARGPWWSSRWGRPV